MAKVLSLIYAKINIFEVKLISVESFILDEHRCYVSGTLSYLLHCQKPDCRLTILASFVVAP